MPVPPCRLLDDLDEETMQNVCDQFQANLSVLDDIVATLEYAEPPPNRIQYVLGLWRLNKLRRMKALLNYDHIEQRIFDAEYADWFAIQDFAYVMDDLDTYD